MTEAAVATTETPKTEPAANAELAQEKPKTPQALRARLVDVVKETRKAEPAPDADRGKSETSPKIEGKKPEKDAAEKAEPKPTEAESEEQKLTRERRDFAKFQRKKETEYATREAKVVETETRLKGELESFDKDPIAWLKARRDLRKVLADMVEEEGKDPSVKKLEAIEKELKETNAKVREREEREVAEAERAQAVQSVERVIAGEWKSADAEAYPTLAEHSKPALIASVGAQVAMQHWRDTFRPRKGTGLYFNGVEGAGEELTPEQLFGRLEKELKAELAKRSEGNPSKKGSPPDKDRSVAKSKPESPEARKRPAEDVTNRTTRTVSDGESRRDRNAIKADLTRMLKERRSS